MFRKFCSSLLKQLEDRPGLYCSEMSFKSECRCLSIVCVVMALSLPTASAGNSPVLPASFPGRRISYIIGTVIWQILGFFLMELQPVTLFCSFDYGGIINCSSKILLCGHFF